MAEVIEVDLSWELREPDEFHVHFRDFSAEAWANRNGGDPGPPELFGGDKHNRLPVVLKYTARQFRRAIAMPNTERPIVNAAMALAYRDRIHHQAVADGYPNFEALMVIYVTPHTTPEIVFEARAAGVVAGKFYAQGRTTGSGHGISEFLSPEMHEVYRAMQECGMLALFHGASTAPGVGVFDLEVGFHDIFRKIREHYPRLKMVFEHISTAASAALVLECGEGVFATVTPQHMLKTREDLLAKGLVPSLYCAPILQTPPDRDAIVAAVVSGSLQFFAGTDSAPHFGEQKHCECGAMGCFNSTHAMEHYAAVFKANAGLDWVNRLEAFTSGHGALAYGLPLNTGTLRLSVAHIPVPKFITGQESGRRIIPFNEGQDVFFLAHRDRM